MIPAKRGQHHLSTTRNTSASRFRQPAMSSALLFPHLVRERTNRDARLPAQKIKMKILLGPEYVSDEEEADSEEASEGEQEDARDTFVDRTTVRKPNACIVVETRFFVDVHCCRGWHPGRVRAALQSKSFAL